MRKKSQSLTIRSILAIFIASIFLISSCEWCESDKDTTKDNQTDTETVSGDATQAEETGDEASDTETMEGEEGEDVADDDIFTVVDQMPEYPGGEEALMQYLADNIKYPEQAVKEGIEGQVFVGFIIQPTGNVDHIKVLKGIGGGCDEEAIRVVSEMPNWKPGYEKGVAVMVEYNVPISFKLN